MWHLPAAPCRHQQWRYQSPKSGRGHQLLVVAGAQHGMTQAGAGTQSGPTAVHIPDVLRLSALQALALLHPAKQLRLLAPAGMADAQLGLGGSPYC